MFQWIQIWILYALIAFFVGCQLLNNFLCTFGNSIFNNLVQNIISSVYSPF